MEEAQAPIGIEGFPRFQDAAFIMYARAISAIYSASANKAGDHVLRR